MKKYLVVLAVFVCLAAQTYAQQPSEGSLYAAGKNGAELGACPLKTTSVRTDISGFLARVNVRQEFQNSFAEPIEAVYVFPLGASGAVDRMTMTIGERIINGRIMRREIARQTYETAKQQGRAASLLDQERPNIFTQSVANIMPGETIIVEISYVETLKYEEGAYEFVFPMTIGKRYIPASVADGDKISPTADSMRNGSDISIEVNLNAGVPVESIRSSSHEIDQVNFTPNTALIKLRGEKTIPNKDFILRYDVTGKRIEDALLTHRADRGGFFTLILQPPDMPATEDRTPKEIVFVLDTSGSMGGFPIEKAKEAMKLSMEGLYPEDTFNLITFAGDTAVLFDRPVPATRANLDVAQQFLASRQGSGGTEMMKAIKASLDPSDSQEHLRIVCFMTDGYVGNDDEIIAEIKSHPKARIFSFGVGDSVNRSLLDRMAQEGKGEVEYVGLESEGSPAAKRFYERVRSPLLTDISIDWGGMPVADVYPGKLTDLFSSKPVILHGRYKGAATGAVKLKGTLAGQPYERIINVNLPETNAANDSLATLWARTRVDDLTTTQISTSNAAKAKELVDSITNLGLEYGIMTKYTSFVAVKDQVSNPTGDPKKVGVAPFDPNASNKPTNARPDLRGAYKKWINNDVAYIVTKEEKAKFNNSVANGQGVGSGTGSGSGSGVGYGAPTSGSVNVTGGTAATTPGPITATVEVTGDSNYNSADTSIQTTITRRVVEELPKGTTFSSLLKLSPNSRPQGLAGGFQIDGASGSESVFFIGSRLYGSEFSISTEEYFAEYAGGGDPDAIRLEGLELAIARANSLDPAPDTRSRTERLTNERLQGRVAAAAEPVYPVEAAEARALGIVEVQIATDLEGTVISAKAVSGNAKLRAASEQAAMLTKFYPTLINGLKARISGKILYDFVSADKVGVYVRSMKALPPTAADLAAIKRSTKLHYWVYDLVMRTERGESALTANDKLFITGSNAHVTVTLAKRSEAAINALRTAGLVITAERGASITGTIAVARIASLADIADVRLITPRS